MSNIFEMPARVDSRDVDLTGCARPAALLGYLQEAATQASLALHVSGPEVNQKYNAFWMVSRIYLRMAAPLCWNDSFTVRTWHRGGKGASVYRDFDLLRGGELLGEATSIWVLADCQTFKLLRMSGVPEFQGTDGGSLCKSLRLHRLKLPETMAPAENRPLRYSDTDINGHINNVHYANFACDALHMENLLTRGQYVSELQIGFLAQCMAGETLQMETAQDDEGRYYARGRADSSDRFEYMQKISPCALPAFSGQLPTSTEFA